MAVVNLVSHINQHVSMLTQVVEKALVEEAEKLRKEFGKYTTRANHGVTSKTTSLNSKQILKITESMVQEEAEAMQDSTWILVLLKQQELALRQQDQELKHGSGKQQGLKSNNLSTNKI